MSDILENILRMKREEVAERQRRVPLDALKETITTLGRPRNFFNAVTRG
jgi:indole-3-glycerol phosphate synthase